MTATHITAWFDLLEKACAKLSSTYLDIIIDQLGSDTSLLRSVRSVQPPLLWRSLFTGLPEEGLEHLAPLLVRVDLEQPLQRQWLISLMRHLDGESQLLALVSLWPFQALAEHFGQCMEARNGGCLSLFHFYDPRLFPLLFSHALLPEQQQLWLRPAVFWSWLDRDGAPKRLLGVSDAPEVPGPIELSDSQVETLCCVGDATRALANLNSALPQQWSREQRFQACYAAMLEATEAGLLMDNEREAFVLDKLLEPATDLAQTGKPPHA
ncbi:hypothetical protein M2401_006907 [Pseudomonas sp. JUb42]|uniref:DUF4123 domain-containing protein n=1 Tax=Pseudomonas sp. JUb42 TaxID=2940611 RepID=UPI00216A4659|nr:DUF4123 domain-containing protein [Pseudomonas sp. JUb42]MCS3473139.1 hypothetical protein [Pseudomonas sp. JUb42]